MTSICIAIVGSRTFHDKGKFYKEMDNFLSERNIPPKSFTVVSGGAQGADSLAREWCKDNEIQITEHIPDYRKRGRNDRGAPLERNTEIVNDCDYFIAFWKANSSGTKNSILKAKKKFGNRSNKIKIVSI